MLTRCLPAAGAAILLCAAAMPAGAQLGQLTKRAAKAATGKAADKPGTTQAPAGAARVSAVIDWTVETTTIPAEWAGDMSWTANIRQAFGIPDSPLGPNTFTPATSVDTERGSVTLQLDMDPNDLPGGPQSRMLGGRTTIGLTQGQPMMAGQRVVSLTGTVSLDRTVSPIGACKRTTSGGNAMVTDPPTVSMAGRREYRASDTDVGVSFLGAEPVGLSVGRTGPGMRGVDAQGRGTYACGGSFAARDTQNAAGVSLLVMDGTNWVTQAQPTAGGYALTGRAEEKSQGWRVVRTVKLTWTAPPPPSAQQAGGGAPPNVADQMKFDAGKGSITFTQQGKLAKWPLQSVAENNQAGVKSTTMMFTPDGAMPSEEKGVLALSITSVMGQTMVGLNLARGPAGDSEFEAEECSAQLKPSVGKDLSGTGECKKSGVSVKFTFASAKSP